MLILSPQLLSSPSQSAFQIKSCLRFSLLSTCDLLSSYRNPLKKSFTSTLRERATSVCILLLYVCKLYCKRIVERLPATSHGQLRMGFAWNTDASAGGCGTAENTACLAWTSMITTSSGRRMEQLAPLPRLCGTLSYCSVVPVFRE